MEESSVLKEDPPISTLLQCVLQDNNSSEMQWHDLPDKVAAVNNSRLLFLTVEYVQDIGDDAEFTTALENEGITPFDSNLNPERISSLFNTLVIPTDGHPQFQNSVVVLPAPKNFSQQISIVLNQSERERQFVVEGHKNYENETILPNLKLHSESSSAIQSPEANVSDSVNNLNLSEDDQKLIVTEPSSIVLSQNAVAVPIPQHHSFLAAENTFFQGNENKVSVPVNFVSSGTHSVEDEFSPPPSAESILLCRSEVKENKPLLGSSQFVIDNSSLKTDELLLSDSDQNNELLMKSEALLETESYRLTREAYIHPEPENSYTAVEEQLNISNMGKEDNEYLLPDAISFEDEDSEILQSNLEVLTSEVLDNSELLLYDKTRLRQNKKHPGEHLGLEYWCEDCEFGIRCNHHEVKIISDKPVLSRARATLPKELLAINKLNGQANIEGVFARKTIMRRVQFGPVEGQLMKEWANLNESHDDGVQLLLESETGDLLKLDVSNENESNWMRFVRKAHTLKEQNLVLTQQGKSLYFITTRVIPPRQELKVGYSSQYAEKRKLTVWNESSLCCFDCSAIFSSSLELRKHLLIHANDKLHDEKSTNKKTRNFALRGMPNFIRRKANSPNQNEKIFDVQENECLSCHKIFPRTYSLKRHLMLVHSEKDKENSGVIKNIKGKGDKLSVANTLFKKKNSNGNKSEWLCTHCNLTFDNPSVLNLHTLTHAAEDLESEAVLGVLSDISQSVLMNTSRSKTMELLATGMAGETSGLFKVFDAVLDRQQFIRGIPSELASVYHEGEFLVENGDIQCPQCTKEFPSKRELIEHVSTHGKMTFKKCCSASSKPFKCDQCYKSFATDIRLQKHMLVHGSEDTKPYQCATCSKRFLNNSALSCHLKTHNDKKCFECPLCKSEFDQVFGLKEHVKTHAADGFYTCPHCSKVFDGYSVIRKHIRAFHSGHQHVCKDCGKLCPTQDKLRMHSLKHSDHREFLCANCGKQFKRKDKLKEHMKRMHSAEREMKMLSLALKIPSTKDRRFTPKMSPLAYDRFIYKCRSCLVGFKRRGMLVNHLAKRHPDIVPDTVPELNLPILKTTRDYFCQYCDKIYKSSSKRKAHILKNHPGAELPMSNRQKGGIPYVPGMPNPTFSKTVGSVKTTPHGCKWCHKQYASKAKLLQHQRKKHASLLPQSQQMPRLPKNPSSPVGGKTVDNFPAPANGWKSKCRQSNGADVEESIGTRPVQDAFNAVGEVGGDLQSAYKKTMKGLHDNIPCELLHQAMTELSRSLSEYKLPFAGAGASAHALHDGFPKTADSKDGGEEEEEEARVARSWPDLPPYPPR